MPVQCGGDRDVRCHRNVCTCALHMGAHRSATWASIETTTSPPVACAITAASSLEHAMIVLRTRFQQSTESEHHRPRLRVGCAGQLPTRCSLVEKARDCRRGSRDRQSTGQVAQSSCAVALQMPSAPYALKSRPTDQSSLSARRPKKSITVRILGHRRWPSGVSHQSFGSVGPWFVRDCNSGGDGHESARLIERHDLRPTRCLLFGHPRPDPHISRQSACRLPRSSSSELSYSMRVCLRQ